MASSRRTVLFTGIGLIASGVVLGLVAVGGSRAVISVVPIAAGVVLCLAGGFSRVPGLYLPGVLLIGAGTGVLLTLAGGAASDESHLIGTFLACEAVALGVLPLLSRLTGWHFVLWPLFPAGAIGVWGIALLAADPTGALGGFVAGSWRLVVALSVAFVVMVVLRSRSARPR